MNRAFIFPGQASQYVGMGRDLVSEFPEARETFDQADGVLGFPLSKLCFEGPEAILTDTINTQPALLTHSIASLRVFQSHSPEQRPAFVAGHSMGEFAALVAAGAVEFPDALILIRERGRVMKSAGQRMPGMMAAVLGMDDQALEEICLSAGVQIANYNAPGQIVISGPKEGMEQAIALTKSRGAKRTVPLAVSIAAHSICMESGVAEFAGAVARTPVRTPTVPVVSNVTARPLHTVEEIRQELVAQLTSSVQWVRSIEYMIEQGVAQFVELGPKDVLAGLVRRINKQVRAISVGDVASVKAFAGPLSGGA
ncbi:MAG: ACP S-malonyltransferase [Chloroflexi bacterium]|nr:ACP S-malonyltransferase [Chloroflexota bacterium]